MNVLIIPVVLTPAGAVPETAHYMGESADRAACGIARGAITTEPRT